MKIKMLAMWASALGSFDIGSTPDIEDDLADELIHLGHAEEFVEAAPIAPAAPIAGVDAAPAVK